MQVKISGTPPIHHPLFPFISLLCQLISLKLQCFFLAFPQKWEIPLALVTFLCSVSSDFKSNSLTRSSCFKQCHGQEVANRYSATANYKTTVTNKYVKNYIVSATYSGTIEKESEPTYTAIFLGQKLFDFKIIKIILWSLLIVGALTGIGFIIKRRRG